MQSLYDIFSSVISYHVVNYSNFSILLIHTLGFWSDIFVLISEVLQVCLSEKNLTFIQIDGCGKHPAYSKSVRPNQSNILLLYIVSHSLVHLTEYKNKGFWVKVQYTVLCETAIWRLSNNQTFGKQKIKDIAVFYI